MMDIKYQIDGKVSPHFAPFVGMNYAQQEERLLLLGESHYGVANRNSTKQWVQEFSEERWTDRFWAHAMQAVDGRPHREIERIPFWRNVALYNYVQQVVAESAGISPTRAMFDTSEGAFETVLDVLQPAMVLVIGGVRLWNHLPELGGRHGPELDVNGRPRVSWRYPYCGGEALATYTRHVSRFPDRIFNHQLVGQLRQQSRLIRNIETKSQCRNLYSIRSI